MAPLIAAACRRLAPAVLGLALAVCALSPALALPSAVTPDAGDSSPGPAPMVAMPNADDDNSVCFEPETAVIDERGRQAISAYAKKLKNDSRLRVVLRGFADDQGSRAYNLARSQERIDAVERALERLGVASFQIRKRTLGLAKSGAAELTASDCRQWRRRVDVVLSK